MQEFSTFRAPPTSKFYSLEPKLTVDINGTYLSSELRVNETPDRGVTRVKVKEEIETSKLW